MAIGFNAFASLLAGFNGISGACTLANYTVGAGANRILFVTVLVKATNTSGATITNVKYGGVAMSTLLSSIQTNKGMIAIFYMVAPPSGSNAVTATVSNPSLGTTTVAVLAADYTGVDQGSPIASSTSGAENAATSSTYPFSFALPISGGSYGFQVGRVLYGGVDGPSTGETPFSTRDTNNTLLKSSGGGTTAGDVAEHSHGAYGGISANLGWTANAVAAYDYIVAAVSLNPVLPQQINLDVTAFGVTSSGEVNQAQRPVDAQAFTVSMSGQSAQVKLPVAPQAYAVVMSGWRGQLKQLGPVLGGFTLSFPTRRRRMIWPPNRGLFKGG